VPGVAAYVRSLDPRLSRSAWLLLSGSFANAFGNGVVFPFVLIYLHNVRGIELGTAGLALAVVGLASLVGNAAAGSLIDRIGAKAMLTVAMVVSVVGFAGYAFVTERSVFSWASATASSGRATRR
jgi:predicted MFS family arabinose efflux permease